MVVLGLMSGTSLDGLDLALVKLSNSGSSYALIKAEFFALIITSVSSYQGFITSGGAKEVGDSGTRAVVYSCIIILLFDLILTQLLLTA